MPLISIAGGALFAERFGTGSPTVLALHGWGRRGSDFAAALGRFDAIALDLPGFGVSPPPSAVLGAEGYAGLIGPVFEMFDLPPVVVGHSFGGRVAVAGQFFHPGSGLILVGSPLVRPGGPRRRPSLAYRLARGANRFGLVSDDRLEAEKRRRGSADYRAATGVMRDILVKVVNESYEEELVRLNVPVHLLWGAEDTEVPVSVAEAAARIIESSGAQVDVEVLDGVGHHIPLTAPAALANAVGRMLAEVSS
ncbi:MAG: alpha/beta fold hydrolase [Acidimicrobiia bacterium]